MFAYIWVTQMFWHTISYFIHDLHFIVSGFPVRELRERAVRGKRKFVLCFRSTIFLLTYFDHICRPNHSYHCCCLCDKLSNDNKTYFCWSLGSVSLHENYIYLGGECSWDMENSQWMVKEWLKQMCVSTINTQFSGFIISAPFYKLDSHQAALKWTKMPVDTTASLCRLTLSYIQQHTQL